VKVTGDRDKQSIARLLRSATLFDTLDELELGLVAAHAEVLELSEGSVLFRPGDAGSSLFVLEHGELAIRSDLGEDTGRELARFIGGESVGELDLLVNSARSAYAVAAQPTRMARFPASDQELSQLLHSRPELGAHILFKLLGNLAGRLRSTNRLLSENAPWIRELKRQVYIDKLTGLYNTAFLAEELEKHRHDAARPLTLLMMKPDNFKEINDTYGHEAGDLALKQLASSFGTAVRQTGTAVRYRGNELIALLPDTSHPDAEQIAERLGNEIKSMQLTPEGHPTSTTVTVSFGIGRYPQDGLELDELVTQTHALLFEARTAGGDRILRVGGAS